MITLTKAQEELQALVKISNLQGQNFNVLAEQKEHHV